MLGFHKGIEDELSRSIEAMQKGYADTSAQIEKSGVLLPLSDESQFCGTPTCTKDEHWDLL